MKYYIKAKVKTKDEFELLRSVLIVMLRANIIQWGASEERMQEIRRQGKK